MPHLCSGNWQELLAVWRPFNGVCNGESDGERLAIELRKGFPRGVVIALLSEGVEKINWEQTEAAAGAKALGYAGSMLPLSEWRRAMWQRRE